MRATRRTSAVPAKASALALVLRTGLVLLVVAALVTGVTGGLVRAGAWSADLAGKNWLVHASIDHAALMLSAFLGSVIGVERAVAIGHPAAFAGPLASALGGLCLLAGQPDAAGWLGLMAAAVFVAMNLVFLVRQPEPHIALLLLGALAWAGGNILFAIDHHASRALTWWFSFVILTIAAERLEMHRLMRAQAMAYPLLFAIVACLAAGTVASLASPVWSGVLFGIALMALALWLWIYDVARRTVRTQGLARYMAVCLLGGYVWLAIAGLAWLGTAVGCPGRDVALHALGLGFVISMVMGHAPVILPAVARVKLRFGPWFYVPLASLHISLVVRLLLPMAWPMVRHTGVVLNVVTLVLFAATLLLSAFLYRSNPSARPVAAPMEWE